MHACTTYKVIQCLVICGKREISNIQLAPPRTLTYQFPAPLAQDRTLILRISRLFLPDIQTPDTDHRPYSPAVVWTVTPKIDRATLSFLKFDMGSSDTRHAYGGKK